MTLSLRACAALLLPFVLASGNVVAYSQLRCRDGSIRKSCCCTRHAHETAGPALSRSCCTVETIQTDRTPGSEARRAPELSAPALAFAVPPRAPDATELPARFAEHRVLSDSGPPILLKTCTLLS